MRGYYIWGKVKFYIFNFLKKLNLIKEIHYINGSETLPPPLTKAQEAKIMNKKWCNWSKRTFNNS